MAVLKRPAANKKTGAKAKTARKKSKASEHDPDEQLALGEKLDDEGEPKEDEEEEEEEEKEEEEKEEEEEEKKEKEQEEARHADCRIVRGKGQSYIQHKMGGKWVLLIAVSANQSSRHAEIVEAMLGRVHDLGMNKQSFVDLRRSLLEKFV